eukprot:scaffold694_cov188-Prasinococcus_capsulatus_cf.AAC.5
MSTFRMPIPWEIASPINAKLLSREAHSQCQPRSKQGLTGTYPPAVSEASATSRAVEGGLAAVAEDAAVDEILLALQVRTLLPPAQLREWPLPSRALSTQFLPNARVPTEFLRPRPKPKPLPPNMLWKAGPTSFLPPGGAEFPLLKASPNSRSGLHPHAPLYAGRAEASRATGSGLCAAARATLREGGCWRPSCRRSHLAPRSSVTAPPLYTSSIHPCKHRHDV